MSSTLAKAAAALVTSASLALCGCTAEPSTQTVTIAYSDAGATMQTSVDVDGIRCTSVAGQSLLGSTEPHDGTQAVFVASARTASGTFLTGVSLGDDVWFLSEAPFDLLENGAAFDDIVGTVARGDSIASATDIIDDGAMLSAEIRCTTGELK